MNTVNKYTKEVEQALAKHANKMDAATHQKLQRYLGTQLQIYGLSSPLQKRLCKEGYGFYAHDKAETFQIYTDIYKESHIHEVRSQGLIFLEQNYRHISLPQQLAALPGLMAHSENWAHSDFLSKFYTRLLEDQLTSKGMLEHLQAWNQSENLWERRQSLVSLLYYARTKKQYLPFRQLIAFARPLLHDEAYYVQKGLGWFLREAYNVYPEDTYRFIDQHILDIAPAAFTTSIEKMNAREKETLKLKRKRR